MRVKEQSLRPGNTRKLKYTGLAVRHKEKKEQSGLSELEFIINGCRTTPAELVDLMAKYNREIQRSEGPDSARDVQVGDFYMSDQVFGCNQAPNAYYNKKGIYFSGKVGKDRIVFRLPKHNKSFAWLLDFCFQYMSMA